MREAVFQLVLTENYETDNFIADYCHFCTFYTDKVIYDAVLMCGFSLPTMTVNLVLYALIGCSLRRRLSASNSSRDATLTRAFMLLSLSWMILWLPKTVFSVYYAFVGKQITSYDVRVGLNSPSDFKKNFVAEFVVLQISYLFSSVNSVILIVLIKPFQDPVRKVLGKLKSKFSSAQ